MKHSSDLAYLKIKTLLVTICILTGLKPNDLSIDKLRGQGYDGAANMSGEYSVVQARILEKAPYAKYVHCAAHNLNLVLN